MDEEFCEDDCGFITIFQSNYLFITIVSICF
jgi:hypothetical protein